MGQVAPHRGAQRRGAWPQAGAQLQVGEQASFHQVHHHVLVADEQVSPGVGHRAQGLLCAGFAQQPGLGEALTHQGLDAGTGLHCQHRPHQVRGKGRPGERRVRLALAHRRGEG
ncbi:MAG TPA: hypothetical protein VFL86_09335 [Burkholderiaceae bacterium]|nr:hypothetical protein [Burkholderiaceae bacterium]